MTLSIFARALFFFLVIDLPVIMYLNRGMYKRMFDRINGDQVVNTTRLAGSAVIAYLAMALMLSRFAHDWKSGALLGFCFGLIYNFTNAATVARYSMRVAVLDTIWVTTLFGIVSYLVYRK